MSETRPSPRHRAPRKTGRIVALNLGIDSLTLDPSYQMGRLRREIMATDPMAEAWNDTTEALNSAMSRFQASTHSSSR